MIATYIRISPFIHILRAAYDGLKFMFLKVELNFFKLNEKLKYYLPKLYRAQSSYILFDNLFDLFPERNDQIPRS